MPCRVLGCLNGKCVQEHFIVEVWAPGMGWGGWNRGAFLSPILASSSCASLISAAA